MARENNEMGRRARPRLNERFPGFPNVSLVHPEVSEVDAKIISFARNVMDVIEEFQDKGWATSQRDFARRVGLNHATLIGILQGKTYPDAETIALLEVGTRRPLWERTSKFRSDRKPPAFRKEEDSDIKIPE